MRWISSRFRRRGIRQEARGYDGPSLAVLEQNDRHFRRPVSSAPGDVEFALADEHGLDQTERLRSVLAVMVAGRTLDQDLLERVPCKGAPLHECHDDRGLGIRRMLDPYPAFLDRDGRGRGLRWSDGAKQGAQAVEEA